MPTTSIIEASSAAKQLPIVATRVSGPTSRTAGARISSARSDHAWTFSSSQVPSRLCRDGMVRRISRRAIGPIGVRYARRVVNGPILFLVPARGGSRRVPGKNLRAIGGVPLVGRAVRTARAAAGALPGGPHRVACSTDDPAIAQVAAAWGADVIDRPAALATDDATSIVVVLHALGELPAGQAKYRTLVLLQPTSPLVEPADIVAAVERHWEAGGAPVTSVTATHPASWHLATDAEGVLRALIKATASDDRLLAGAFYVVDAAELARSRRLRRAGPHHRHVDPG